MRPIARLSVLTLVLSLLPLGQPSAAPASRSLVRAAERVKAAAVRGGVGEAILAAAAAGDRRVETLVYAPAVLPPGTPPALRTPLADLLGAIRAADEAARAAVHASPAEIDRAAAEATALMDAALADPYPALAARARAHLARVQRMMDAPALLGAAAAVGAAIDRAIPALRAAGSGLPASDGEGCDVVEQAGALCVAGTGATTITGEYALVVDLGGDDIHRHSAGGASVLANGLAAAVTIDVGGNDVYDTRIGEDTPSTAAQGAGRSGGIGMLVDASGDDVYSITAAKPDATQILGHGASVLGAGVLADQGGDDSYAITNTQPSTATHAQGQGFAVLGPLGMFLDTGQGNDTISDDASPPPLTGAEGELVASRARAECCASGVGASLAVYVDDGGTDRTEVSATSALEEPGMPDQAVVSSHGLSGLGGLAISITGPGDTERISRALSSGPTAGNATTALGAEGALGGASVSIDGGGDDRYRSEGRSVAVHELVLVEDCACDRVKALAGTVFAGGLGYGTLGGEVEQVDASGDDVYELVAVSSAAASVTDERTHPEGSVVELPAVDAEGGVANPLGLGFGAAASQASFTDAAGADSYLVRGRNDAAASSAPDAPGYVHDVRSFGGSGFAEALGAGFGDFGGAAPAAGHFRDLGGGDTYTVALTSEVSSVPTGGAFEGEAVVSVLGSVEQNALATFLDEGGADTVSIVPEDAACEGTRGEGSWQDCGTLLGRGENR